MTYMLGLKKYGTKAKRTLQIGFRVSHSRRKNPNNANQQVKDSFINRRLLAKA